MSFAARLRRKRPKGLLILAALAGSIGLAANVVPNTSTPETREFADTAAPKKRAVAQVENRVKGGPRRLRWDSRKARRRLLMQLVELPNSGRQWEKVRRAIRRGPYVALLSLPAWRLAQMVAAKERRVA